MTLSASSTSSRPSSTAAGSLMPFRTSLKGCAPLSPGRSGTGLVVVDARRRAKWQRARRANRAGMNAIGRATSMLMPSSAPSAPPRSCERTAVRDRRLFKLRTARAPSWLLAMTGTRRSSRTHVGQVVRPYTASLPAISSTTPPDQGRDEPARAPGSGGLREFHHDRERLHTSTTRRWPSRGWLREMHIVAYTASRPSLGSSGTVGPSDVACLWGAWRARSTCGRRPASEDEVSRSPRRRATPRRRIASAEPRGSICRAPRGRREECHAPA